MMDELKPNVREGFREFCIALFAGGPLISDLELAKNAKRLVDAVETAGVDPCDAAADHWRHVHNRIAAGHQPRLYTIERHHAWLKRREIEG